MSEFCLSDEAIGSPHYLNNIYFEKDVKEFIRRLKEDLFDWVGGIDDCIEDCDAVDKIINKRAGEGLV